MFGSALSAMINCSPESFGSIISSTMTSGTFSRANRNPSSPSAATRTRYPDLEIANSFARRRNLLSSISNTVSFIALRLISLPRRDRGRFLDFFVRFVAVDCQPPGNCLPVGDILLRFSVCGLRFRKQTRGFRDHRTLLPRFFLISVGFRFSGRLFSNAVGRELGCRKFSLFLQLSQYAVSFLGVAAPAWALFPSDCDRCPTMPRKCAVRWLRPCTAFHTITSCARRCYCPILLSSRRRLKRKCRPGPWLEMRCFGYNPLLRGQSSSCVSWACRYQLRGSRATDRPKPAASPPLAISGITDRKQGNRVSTTLSRRPGAEESAPPLSRRQTGRSRAPRTPHNPSSSFRYARHPQGILHPAVPECAERYPVSRASDGTFQEKSETGCGTARPSRREAAGHGPRSLRPLLCRISRVQRCGWTR
jgi:hypothetical protein